MGIAISAVALLGSLIGTLSVIFSAPGKGERTYLAMGYLVLWLLAFGFLALCFLLPSPWAHVALVAFFVVIPVGAFRITMKSQIIRKAESLKNS
ncbi:MAG: hypothetical protein PHP44_01435 [Kiritimatiellae bacterium]|nr:hypothetical protein [Kiritimatiellia bacterium]MDD4734748.1 hypothetical protein [Kiritimatiellia bacterium]